MSRDSAQIIALQNHSPSAVEIPVLKVFDGDGFLTRLKVCDFVERSIDRTEVEVAVRLGFIDAPEIGQPGGKEARDFLSSLISGRNVWIDVLKKMDTGKTVDGYGRIVAIPFIEERYDSWVFVTPSLEEHRAHNFGSPIMLSRNVELEMVLNGWAWVLERYGPDESYLAALEDARTHGRGIWAYSNNVHPWKYKQKMGAMARRNTEAGLFDSGRNCPQPGCSGTLIKKQGRFGSFMGCSNFPRCRYTSSL